MRALAILFAAAAALAAAPVAAENMSHVHIGHVMTGWNDTPDGQGLLPTAQAEAKIARRHIDFALADPKDLGSIKVHTRHVLHAVDPTAEPAGPGLGYGLKKAAVGVMGHIRAAADSDGASDNVSLHTEHVATSAGNVFAWSEEIIFTAKAIITATQANPAAQLAQRVKTLLICITAGCDTNGDGKIGWQKGEGGLAQAAQHMGFMMKGEGLE